MIINTCPWPVDRDKGGDIPSEIGRTALSTHCGESHGHGTIHSLFEHVCHAEIFEPICTFPSTVCSGTFGVHNTFGNPNIRSGPGTDRCNWMDGMLDGERAKVVNIVYGGGGEGWIGRSGHTSLDRNATKGRSSGNLGVKGARPTLLAVQSMDELSVRHCLWCRP